MIWKRVYSSPQQYLTAMMVDLLVNTGIEAVLISKRDSSYPIGFYEAHVPENKLVEATAVVDQAIQASLNEN